MKKVALITGVSGQDGSYLAELLLSKDYEVHGVIRRTSQSSTQRIDHIFDPESKAFIHYGQLEEGIDKLIYELQPDEIYNIGSMSQVRISFEIPIYTADVTGIAPLRILEGIRLLGLKNKTKFYQASSSEMFGISPPPQNENTPMLPISPYGASKLFAYHITRTYRFGYGIFASNGILFNHESERRGENFVTRKITKGACRIKLGLQDKIKLGNLDAKRDWGYAKDYVEAIWMILQHNEPDDFIVATEEYHSVREFVDKVFAYLDLDPKKYIEVVDDYRRPNEVPALLGDSFKIRNKLNWQPKVKFNDLIKIMVDADLKLAHQELLLKENK